MDSVNRLMFRVFFKKGRSEDLIANGIYWSLNIGTWGLLAAFLFPNVFGNFVIVPIIFLGLALGLILIGLIQEDA